MRIYEIYLSGGRKAENMVTVHSMPYSLGPWKESN
jgi:hypothetical protein